MYHLLACKHGLNKDVYIPKVYGECSFVLCVGTRRYLDVIFYSFDVQAVITSQLNLKLKYNYNI